MLANEPNPTAAEPVQTPGQRVGVQVLRVLGRPSNLRAIIVRPLWENRYRVNIYLGDDLLTATIANSYFLTTDDDGIIRTVNPRLAKEY